jgi:hypothetical protein
MHAAAQASIFPTGQASTVGHGSLLDRGYLESLGTWDIVYSWAVLHHTGALWEAAGNVARLVVPGRRLFMSIYNDQGLRSRLWWRLKRRYNLLPRSLRTHSWWA